MSSYEKIKSWLISQEKNITKENFRENVDIIIKNYFLESQEELTLKFKHFNELFNITLRFLGHWKVNGVEYSKQMIYFPNTIEEIDTKFCKNISFFSLLGFSWKDKLPKKEELAPQLVNLGIYSSKISFYSPKEQENIIFTILKKSSAGNWKSYYLSMGPYKEENLRIFLTSKEVKDYFSKTIEEIDIKFCNINSFFSLLGFSWKNDHPKKEELAPQLVNLGIYSSKISFYSPKEQENIISTILKKSSGSNWKSYYLPISPNKEENKLIFKQSSKFKEFLEKNSKSSIKNFLKRYNFSESMLQEKTKFSILQATWRDEEVEYLIQLYEKSPDTLHKEIKISDLAQRQFGRSKNAVLAKLNLLISGKSITKGSGYEIDSRGVTSFPKEIEQYFNEFVNYSQLHAQNSILEEFPVLNYIYPYNKTLTDNSCFVLIVPFEFKGNSLDKYKPFEQHIISRLYSKLIDMNSEELIETNKILEIKLDKNFITDFFSEKTSLVGLYVRKKFSINQNIETSEIPEEIQFESNSKKFNYWVFCE
jgi:hypothetical protein